MLFPMNGLDLVLLGVAFAFTIYAQFKVKGTFNKMSQVHSTTGMTGAQVAKKLLMRNNINDVEVVPVAGSLSDHYDPIKKKIGLSEDVYNSTSLAAISVAAHETGHAIQDQKAYVPLKWRHAVFPMANIGSSMAIPLFFIGLIMSFPFLQTLGIYFFAGAVIFHLVTLPVEFDASNRAMAQLSDGGYLRNDEIKGAKKVLDAAAMTYVAAAAMAVIQLIRMILLSRDE